MYVKKLSRISSFKIVREINFRGDLNTIKIKFAFSNIFRAQSRTSVCIYYCFRIFCFIGVLVLCIKLGCSSIQERFENFFNSREG